MSEPMNKETKAYMDGLLAQCEQLPDGAYMQCCVDIIHADDHLDAKGADASDLLIEWLDYGTTRP